MVLAQAVGEYLRYTPASAPRCRTGHPGHRPEWSQDYEWHVHAPIAAKAGIKPEIINAIREGRRPEAISDDEALVYDFSIELHRNKGVSEATWSRAEVRFGKPAVVDLVGINGYYALLAMQLNAARYQPPKEASKLPGSQPKAAPSPPGRGPG